MGGGGHTEEMLKNSLIKQVYAFDQDSEAITFASERLKKYKNRLTIINSNFEEMRTQLALEKVSGVDGILFDLGVSSHQIDSQARGFGFDKDSELDMRMDQSLEKTAKQVINTHSIEQLAQIFRDFGEEQSAFKIAQWIDKARKTAPINTTSELVSIIERNMRGNPIHAMKTKVRVFQALRIYLNRELEVLDSTLEDAINLLNPKGRMVVISYHSLEDKIVKAKINQAAKGCICPKTILKCMCNQKARIKVLTNKVMTPSEEEVKQNSRSRSAKLRAIEKS
jgi:16S rRNA (cytosine1402-N4)-methyltransferase